MRRGFTLVTGLVVLAGCAPRAAPVELNAAYVPSAYGDSAGAQLALENGDYAEALFMTNRALAAHPADARARYERAMALTELGRTDEALRDYRDAEARFGRDRAGAALAMYGRARALTAAGRCSEARDAYEQYAAEVEPSDAPAARVARAYARDCRNAPPSPPNLDAVARALAAARYADALAQADALPAGPVRDEQRGLALTGLGRTREAVEAFDAAGRVLARTGRTGEEGDGEGGARALRARALYNKARALREGARCADAARAYDEYAAFVRADSPRDADMAQRYARECPGPSPTAR